MCLFQRVGIASLLNGKHLHMYYFTLHYSSVNILHAAKFNDTVQGTLFQNENEKQVTTEQTNTHSERTTDSVTATDIIHNLKESSSTTYIVIGTGIGIGIIILIILIIFILHMVFRKSTSAGVWTSPIRHRQNTANNNILSTSLEETSATVETLTVSNGPNYSAPTTSIVTPSINDSEEDQDQDHKCTSVSTKKFDHNPIYIYLGPEEIAAATSSPSELPLKCEQNRAYNHLGPEDSSTVESESEVPAEPLQIKCNQNLAYPYLGPEDIPLELS